MGRTLQWHGDAWDEYCEWQQTDKATLKRINALIKDARRRTLLLGLENRNR